MKGDRNSVHMDQRDQPPVEVEEQMFVVGWERKRIHWTYKTATRGRK